MKKSVIALVICLAFMCSVLTACGGTEAKQDQVVGNWEMTRISSGSSTISSKEYMKSAEAKVLPALSFTEDNKVRFTGLGRGVDPNGKWTGSNGKYIIDDGQQELECSIGDKGQLELVYPKEDSDKLSADLTIVFRKESEKR
ncbi:MAG: hypothetical protein ACOX4I_06040 [Anaerovoracaceae bacterium]|jgi:hypothetical protein